MGQLFSRVINKHNVIHPINHPAHAPINTSTKHTNFLEHYYALFINSISESENAALIALNDLVQNCGTESLKRRSSISLEIININNKLITIKVDRLGAAFIRNYQALALKLIEYGDSIETTISCEDDLAYDGLTLLMFSCATDLINMVTLCLNNNANLFAVSKHGTTAIMEVKSIPIAKLILDTIWEKHFFQSFPFISENFSWEKVKTKFARRFLHFSRVIALKTSLPQRKTYEEICLKLRTIVGERPTVDFNARVLPPTSFQSAYAALFGPFFAYLSPYPNSKEEAVKRAITQFYVLLLNTSKSIKYLQFLNAEFTRYIIEAAKFDLNLLDPIFYEFIAVAGGCYPIPKENYRYLKKNHALQEYLILLFKNHGLASKAYKWMGFVPKEVANEIIKGGDFFKESRLEFGLFHNSISHMIQLAILIYAVENEEVLLKQKVNGTVQNITIGDIVDGFITLKNYSTKKEVWGSVRDSHSYKIFFFNSPHRLSEFIMRYGKQFKIENLSNYMIRSFVEGLKQNIKAFNHTPEWGDMTIKDFVVNMNDMDITKFSIAPNILKYALSREQSVKSNADYAVIEKNYSPYEMKLTKCKIGLCYDPVNPQDQTTISHFMAAPLKVKFLICQYLDDASLWRLARTCEEMHDFIFSHKTLPLWKNLSPSLYEAMVLGIFSLSDALAITRFAISIGVNTTMEKVKRVKKDGLIIGSANKILITPQQAARMHEEYIKVIVDSENGILILYQGLITADQLLTMPRYFWFYSGHEHLCSLFRRQGVVALRENLIPFEKIISLNLWKFLRCLLTRKGLAALRKKLIILEEISLMDSVSSLKLLIDHLIPD